MEYDAAFPFNTEYCTAKSYRVWPPFPQTHKLACNIVNVIPGVTSFMSDAIETCPGNRDKKSKVKSSTCSNFVCNEHRTEEKKIVFQKHVIDSSYSE